MMPEMPKRSSNQWTRMWVHEDFKDVVKSQAAMRGTSILNYTKTVGKQSKQQTTNETKPPMFRLKF